MKQLFILIIIFSTGVQIGNHSGIKNKTDLEIYTRDNIYYIRGLTVKNEVDGAEKRFKTKEELKEYISNLTAKQWKQ